MNEYDQGGVLTGARQEVFGGEVIGSDTHDTLTRFIEARNAGMAPLLNPQSLSTLYAEDAVLIHPLYGLPTTETRGRMEIEEHFAKIGEVMLSLTHVEDRRTVEGRQAVWEGRIEGVQAGSGARLSIPAVISIRFNEDDLVQWQRSYFSMDVARRQLTDFEIKR